MTASTESMADRARELHRLVKGSDSIELKLTVPETAYRSGAAALGVDPLDAQIRQVFFFDTPDLDLNKAGVVARARRVQGRGDDSVVKLRPVVPADLPASLRKLPEFVVEVDALPGGYVCSASLKGVPRVSVRDTVSGKGPLRKVFSKSQRSFFTEHAPAGLNMDDLDVLGPIFVLKLKLAPKAFSRRLVAEMWMYPDGTRIVELSTKCVPGEGFDVADGAARLPRLEGHPHRCPAGDQDQDRARVLLVRAARQPGVTKAELARPTRRSGRRCARGSSRRDRCGGRTHR